MPELPLLDKGKGKALEEIEDPPSVRHWKPSSHALSSSLTTIPKAIRRKASRLSTVNSEQADNALTAHGSNT
jgi:hypothetical protein